MNDLRLLSLSGGGFRAALFHCGVLRALNMHSYKCSGIDFEFVCAVSGASITATIWSKFLAQSNNFRARSLWPEKVLLELVTKSPRIGGQGNWIVRGMYFWTSKVWKAYLRRWWAKHEAVLKSESCSHPYFLIEMLDRTTGNLAVSYNDRLLIPNSEFFIRPDTVADRLGAVPISPISGIAAAVGFPVYFSPIKFPGCKGEFIDAGVLDNAAVVPFLQILRPRSGQDRTCNVREWLVSDAGALMPLPNADELAIWERTVNVNRLTPVDRAFRLAGVLAQRTYLREIHALVSNHAHTKMSSIATGIIPYANESMWLTTPQLRSHKDVAMVSTSLSRIERRNAVCIMSHGAQAMCRVLEEKGCGPELRETLRNIYLNELSGAA